MRLGVFYHAFTINHWEEIVTEHLDALVASGLADEIECLHLGMVGHEVQRRQCLALCQARLPVEVIGEADEGWEQPTLESLRSRASDFDVVAYHHTKGVTYDLGEMPYGGYASQEGFNAAWRQSMTRATVYNWRRCIQLLGEFQLVGCHWIVHPEQCTGSAGETVEANIHFMGGNYWWARAETIARFDAPLMRNRYDAEMWLGKNGLKDENVYDLTPGWPALETFTG